MNWEALEAQMRPGEEPAEEDYVIQQYEDGSFEVTPTGESYLPEEFDRLMYDIKQDMEERGVWTFVWFLDKKLDFAKWNPED